MLRCGSDQIRAAVIDASIDSGCATRRGPTIQRRLCPLNA
jgi:hypothetical protein